MPLERHRTTIDGIAVSWLGTTPEEAAHDVPIAALPTAGLTNGRVPEYQRPAGTPPEGIGGSAPGLPVRRSGTIAVP